MKNQKKRILILLVAMAFTIGSQAQIFGLGGETEGTATRSNNSDLWGNGMNRDGLFVNFDNENPNGLNITNQTFGETPLGGGMAILLASAAGYTLLKRKKNNKKEQQVNGIDKQLKR